MAVLFYFALLGVMDNNGLKKSLGRDLPSGIVVFLVALPLCLGIALASDAPPVSGIIAGIVGGIVVGLLSGSSLSVSGPAAGLTTIVVSSLTELKSFEIFLLAVLLAGVLQLILGFIKAGAIGNYVPSPVIKGMLAAIGIILILKQIPHALGYDADYEGDESYEQPDGGNTFTTIWAALQTFRPAAAILTVITIVMLVVWELKPLKKRAFFRFVPGALVAVIFAVIINNFIFPLLGEGFTLSGNHLATIPVSTSIYDFASLIRFPDFSGIGNTKVWEVAVTIALVASLESLLSIEAVDKLDPEKRITSKNRELKAQGVGNMIAALIGGLPVTSVIVRSSANVNAGAKSRLSAVFHGLLLLFSILFFENLLNMIPLASLAGILFFVGYKLTSPAIIKLVISRGYVQYVPFLVTVFAILFTNLLFGVIIGIAVGMIFIIRTNIQRTVTFTNIGNNYLLGFKRDVYFLNIQIVKNALAKVPKNSQLLINSEKTGFIDADVIELIEDFVRAAPAKGIGVELEGQLKEIIEQRIKTYLKIRKNTLVTE